MIIAPNKLTLEIFDKFGNLEFRKDQLIKSFVRQWTDMAYIDFCAAPGSIKDTGGTTRSFYRAVAGSILGPDANVNYGIRVGGNNGVVTISQNALLGAIGHGTTSGLLYHKVTSLSAITLTANSTYFTVSRNFDNSSGDAINIEEVGLIWANTSNSWYFLIARDVTGTLVVANLKTFIATYTLSVTV